jgi:hypothetical protein
VVGGEHVQWGRQSAGEVPRSTKQARSDPVPPEAVFAPPCDFVGKKSHVIVANHEAVVARSPNAVLRVKDVR